MLLGVFGDTPSVTVPRLMASAVGSLPHTAQYPDWSVLICAALWHWSGAHMSRGVLYKPARKDASRKRIGSALVSRLNRLCATWCVMVLLHGVTEKALCIPCFALGHYVKSEGLACWPWHTSKDALCSKVVVFVKHFLPTCIPRSAMGHAGGVIHCGWRQSHIHVHAPHAGCMLADNPPMRSAGICGNA